MDPTSAPATPLPEADHAMMTDDIADLTGNQQPIESNNNDMSLGDAVAGHPPIDSASEDNNNNNTNDQETKLASLTLESIPQVQALQALLEEGNPAATKQLYVLNSIKAPTFDQSKRAPLNLVACIDRSGSMGGERLQLVKQTLSFLVTQMQTRDSLALVSFSTESKTHLQMTKMDETGREKAQRIIDGLKADDLTNLSGGLIESLDLLSKYIPSNNEKNAVYSVLLLTDGRANRGITDIPTLVQTVKNFLDSVSFSIFTFGYGTDHDDKMLKEISTAGNGMYYFVSNSEEIPQAFGNCLGGLTTVAAQNIKMELHGLSSSSTIKKVQTKYKTAQTDNSYSITIGDMYSEEERNILVEMEVKSLDQELAQQSILRVKVEYFNVATTSFETKETILSIARPSTVLPAQQSVNRTVDKQLNRITTADALEKANQLARESKMSQAREILNNAINSITNSPTASDPFCVELLKDLKNALSQLRDTSTYSSVGSKRLTSMSMNHSYERSSHTSSSYGTTLQMRTSFTYNSSISKKDGNYGRPPSKYNSSQTTNKTTSTSPSKSSSSSTDSSDYGSLPTVSISGNSGHLPSNNNNNSNGNNGNSTSTIVGLSSHNIEDFYTMGDIMGRGAFSVVREAVSKRDQQKYAVKIFDRSQVEFKLIQREIEILQKLNHPNVLRCIEAFESPKQLQLVLDLMDECLFDYVIDQGKPIQEPLAKKIISQIVDAIEYLHSQNVCHRDLKPENILCLNTNDENNMIVKVADFGLAKEINQLMTVCGTPAYTAPEILEGMDYSMPVDYWGIGIITFMILTECLPFASDNVTEMFQNIIQVQYEFPDNSSVSSEAKDFISKLLVKDPNARMTPSQCKQHPWLN